MLTWFLICQYDDDTMTVVTHWHHPPTIDEINDMVNSHHSTEPSIYYIVRDTTPRKVHSRKEPSK